MRYAGGIRYPDGGGLTAEERARRERVRSAIAQVIAAVGVCSIERRRARLGKGDAKEAELLAFNPDALYYVLVNAVRGLDGGGSSRARPQNPVRGSDPPPSAPLWTLIHSAPARQPAASSKIPDVLQALRAR